MQKHNSNNSTYRPCVRWMPNYSIRTSHDELVFLHDTHLKGKQVAQLAITAVADVPPCGGKAGT